MKKAKIRLCSLLVTVSILLSGCAFPSPTDPKGYTDTDFYFDTIISVTVYDMPNDQAKAAVDACFEYAAEAEKLYSRTVEGSDTDRINKANGEPVEVSDGTVEMLTKALQYSALTDGKFSVTIGALTSLWDFSQENGTPPEQEDIEAALLTIDDSRLSIDGNMVTLSKSDVAIDLGAIAKGYIADQMRDILTEQGVKSAIINLGGNVLLLGSHSDGSNYVVGIQEPFSDDGTPILTVEASDMSIVTSGTYQRYFEYEGRLYHHILDTSTGYPAETGLNSVTIIGPSSTDCDALSTACFLLGQEDGLELIETIDGYEAIFIDTENNWDLSSGLVEEDGRVVYADNKVDRG